MPVTVLYRATVWFVFTNWKYCSGDEYPEDDCLVLCNCVVIRNVLRSSFACLPQTFVSRVGFGRRRMCESTAAVGRTWFSPARVLSSKPCAMYDRLLSFVLFRSNCFSFIVTLVRVRFTHTHISLVVSISCYAVSAHFVAMIQSTALYVIKRAVYTRQCCVEYYLFSIPETTINNDHRVSLVVDFTFKIYPMSKSKTILNPPH